MKKINVNEIQFLNIDTITELDAIYIGKVWGKKLNMIVIFKDIEKESFFKINVYKNFKENKYGVGENFKEIPFNTLLKLKVESKISKKTNKNYTKLIDYKVLETSYIEHVYKTI